MTSPSPALSAAQRAIGDIAPKLASLTDAVLFGDMWTRPELSPRDRSLVTVSTLVALYRTDQLSFHLRTALDNGLTSDELVEAITHQAFYAGWPSAMGAIGVLKTVLTDLALPTSRADEPTGRIESGSGSGRTS